MNCIPTSELGKISFTPCAASTEVSTCVKICCTPDTVKVSCLFEETVVPSSLDSKPPVKIAKKWAVHESPKAVTGIRYNLSNTALLKNDHDEKQLQPITTPQDFKPEFIKSFGKESGELKKTSLPDSSSISGRPVHNGNLQGKTYGSRVQALAAKFNEQTSSSSVPKLNISQRNTPRVAIETKPEFLFGPPNQPKAPVTPMVTENLKPQFFSTVEPKRSRLVEKVNWIGDPSRSHDHCVPKSHCPPPVFNPAFYSMAVSTTPKLGRPTPPIYEPTESKLETEKEATHTVSDFGSLLPFTVRGMQVRKNCAQFCEEPVITTEPLSFVIPPSECANRYLTPSQLAVSHMGCTREVETASSQILRPPLLVTGGAGTSCNTVKCEEKDVSSHGKRAADTLAREMMENTFTEKKQETKRPSPPASLSGFTCVLRGQKKYVTCWKGMLDSSQGTQEPADAKNQQNEYVFNRHQHSEQTTFFEQSVKQKEEKDLFQKACSSEVEENPLFTSTPADADDYAGICGSPITVQKTCLSSQDSGISTSPCHCDDCQCSSLDSVFTEDDLFLGGMKVGSSSVFYLSHGESGKIQNEEEMDTEDNIDSGCFCDERKDSVGESQDEQLDKPTTPPVCIPCRVPMYRSRASIHCQVP